MISKVRVLTGGPYHPVTKQFEGLASDFRGEAEFSFHDGVEAFDVLRDCSLLVLGGLHWSGSAPDAHVWPEGVSPSGYVAPSEDQKKAYVDYVRSGGPLLAWHGGIASYDDWPEFSLLCGFRWDWAVTSHADYKTWQVEVWDTGHPVVEGVESYTIEDELYYNVQLTPGFAYEVHGTARVSGENMRFPMILTGEGGRIPGAGKTAYLANGHSLASTSCPAFRKVALNTIRWLLS